MLKSEKAEADIRTLLPLAAVMALTFLGAMFLTKLSIGIALAAVVAFILGLVCFINPADRPLYPDWRDAARAPIRH